MLPATVKQKELIADILSKIEDADRMHEYYDYLQRPTRENATEFITQALENNLDIIAKKKNYIDYLANRPRVERIGTHGLFSNELFQRSHKKGNPYASFELGKLYESGRGTERNTDLAKKCYRVAFLGFLNLEKKSRDDTLWYRIGTMYLQGVGTEADEKEAEKDPGRNTGL